MTIARIRTAVGAMACASVRDTDAIVRNNIDMAISRMNEMRKKKKNAPGVRLRFIIK